MAVGGSMLFQEEVKFSQSIVEIQIARSKMQLNCGFEAEGAENNQLKTNKLASLKATLVRNSAHWLAYLLTDRCKV